METMGLAKWAIWAMVSLAKWAMVAIGCLCGAHPNGNTFLLLQGHHGAFPRLDCLAQKDTYFGPDFYSTALFVQKPGVSELRVLPLPKQPSTVKTAASESEDSGGKAFAECVFLECSPSIYGQRSPLVAFWLLRIFN